MPANLNRIAAAIAMDRWEEIGENTNIWNPDEEAQSFECDPLYIVCAQQRERENTDTQDILRTIMKSPRDLDKYMPEVTPEDMMQAKTIRNYYRNIIMVKQLKDEPLLDQMKLLNTIITDERAINRELIPVLNRMPAMYREDIETAELFKMAKEPSKAKKQIRLDEVVRFAGQVQKTVGGIVFKEFYFLGTHADTLFAATVRADTIEEAGWRYISKQGNIKVTGSAKRTKKINHELTYYDLMPDIEITK
jgi:hypothetical protein